jgi:hypothetical protein
MITYDPIPQDLTDQNELVRLINERLEDMSRRHPVISGDVDMRGYRIRNLGEPVDSTDASPLHRASRVIRRTAPVEAGNTTVINNPVAPGVEPTQLTSGDISLTITYTSDATGAQYAKIAVTYTPTGEAGTLVQVWGYQAASPPSDPKDFKDPMTFPMGGVIEWYVDRPKAGTVWQYAFTVSSGTYWKIPDANTPVKTATITAWGVAPQVTGFSVTVDYSDRGGVPSGRFVYAWTVPASAEYRYCAVERIACDATYTPLVGAVWTRVAGDVVPKQNDWWPQPTAREYWQFRARSANIAEELNSTAPPTVNVTVDPSSGIASGDSPADPITQAGFSATVVQYAAKPSGEQLALIRVSYSPPGNADLVGIWVYEGGDPGSNYNAYQNVTYYNNGATAEFWWPRPVVGATLYIRMTSDKKTYFAKVDANTPVTSVTLSAWGVAPQVTFINVTVSYQTAAGLPQGRFTYSWGKPVHPEFRQAYIERIACDAAFNPLGGADWQRVAGEQNSGTTSDWWPRPANNEYWKFRARSVNDAGVTNDTAPPTQNVTVLGGAKLNLGSDWVDPNSLGAGLGWDPVTEKLIIPAGAVVDQMIGSLAANKILAGTITAAVSMTSPSLSITGGLFTMAMNSSVGLTVNANGEQLGINSNFMYVQGSGGVYARYGSQLFYVQNSSYLTRGYVDVFGAYLEVDSPYSSGIVVRSTSTGDSIFGNGTGAYLSFTGSGSYLNAGELRLGGSVVIDSSRNVRWFGVYNETIALGGITINQWIAAYNSSGSYIGKIPIIP